MVLKFIILLKRMFRKKEAESSFYSCSPLCYGINFFPNNIIKCCCHTSSKEVNVFKLHNDGKNNFDIMQRNRKKLFNRLKKGNIPEYCRKCPLLEKKKSWEFSYTIKEIVFNYYMFCNLRCSHCGYLKHVRFKSQDTKDKLVFDAIKDLEKKSILSKDYSVAIGGGEPSLNNNLDEIINYLVQNKHSVLINSNVAKFKENYIKGIKLGLITLILTPDAGSREVYKKIKGADYFDTVKENIKKYMDAASENIIVKFILEKGNVCDIENMVKLCTDCGVKNVRCSFDLNIKEEDYDYYKPYFIKFRNLCLKNNLNFSHMYIPKQFLK